MLENLMKLKYNNINKKLNKLKDEQTNNTQQQEYTFHQCIDNLSNIIFTEEEMTLLNKGLKYNLHHKQKHQIQTLAIEADTAINLLNQQE
jgi:hypothetical protein